MIKKPLLLEVIMPAYLKGGTIVESVTRLQKVLTESRIDFAIHIIVDGPDEVTEKAIMPLTGPRIRVSIFSENRGKGAVLHHGIRNSVSNYVAFIDADLDIHPDSIVVGLAHLQRSEDDFLVCAYGSKFHIDSNVEYPLFRKLASSFYRLLVRILFQLDVDDSQTGLKVFKTEAIQAVIDQSIEKRFLFDLEIFSLMAKKGYRFTPVPVALDYQYTSTIGMSAASSMISGTIRLALRMGANKSQNQKI